MNNKTSLILAISLITCMVSCEKDYIEDPCTIPVGGTIGGWDEKNDSSVVPKNEDGNFVIEVTEWGDSIVHTIHL